MPKQNFEAIESVLARVNAILCGNDNIEPRVNFGEDFIILDSKLNVLTPELSRINDSSTLMIRLLAANYSGLAYWGYRTKFRTFDYSNYNSFPDRYANIPSKNADKSVFFRMTVGLVAFYETHLQLMAAENRLFSSYEGMAKIAAIDVYDFMAVNDARICNPMVEFPWFLMSILINDRYYLAESYREKIYNEALRELSGFKDSKKAIELFDYIIKNQRSLINDDEGRLNLLITAFCDLMMFHYFPRCIENAPIKAGDMFCWNPRIKFKIPFIAEASSSDYFNRNENDNARNHQKLREDNEILKAQGNQSSNLDKSFDDFNQKMQDLLDNKRSNTSSRSYNSEIYKASKDFSNVLKLEGDIKNIVESFKKDVDEEKGSGVHWGNYLDYKGPKHSGRQIIKNESDIINPIKKKLNRLMVDTDPMFDPGHTAGRLNVQKYMKRSNVSEMEIFDRWEIKSPMASIEISVLLDLSGSMGGSFEELTRVVYILSKAFHGYNDIGLSIIGFGSFSALIKPPNGPAIDMIHEDGMLNTLSDLGGTMPHSAVKTASEIFKRSKRKNHALVIMTDGAWGFDDSDYLIHDMNEQGVYTSLMFFNNDNHNMSTRRMEDHFGHGTQNFHVTKSLNDIVTIVDKIVINANANTGKVLR